MSDREKLIELLQGVHTVAYNNTGILIEEGLADHLLANGVTVQKHGRWVNERELVGGFNSVWGCDCSECGRTIKTDDGKPTFCPECGARMDGK